MSGFSQHKRQDYLKNHKGLVYKYGHDMVVKGIKKNNPNSNSSIPKVVIRKNIPNFIHMQEGISYFSEKGRLTFSGQICSRDAENDCLRFDAFANMGNYSQNQFFSKNNPYNEEKNSLTAYEAYAWLCQVKATLQFRCRCGGVKIWFGQNWQPRDGACDDCGMQYATWGPRWKGKKVIQYSEGLIQGIDLEKQQSEDNNRRVFNAFFLKLKNIERFCTVDASPFVDKEVAYYLTIDCSRIAGYEANCATKIDNQVIFSYVKDADTYSPNVHVSGEKVIYYAKIKGIKDGETITRDIQYEKFVNSREQIIFDDHGHLLQDVYSVRRQHYVLDCYKTKARRTQWVQYESVFPNSYELRNWFEYSRHTDEHFQWNPQRFLLNSEHRFKGKMEYGYYAGDRDKDGNLTYSGKVQSHAMKKWRRFHNAVKPRDWDSNTMFYETYKGDSTSTNYYNRPACWGFRYGAILSALNHTRYRIRAINKRKRLVSSEYTEFYFSIKNYGPHKY